MYQGRAWVVISSWERAVGTLAGWLACGEGLITTCKYLQGRRCEPDALQLTRQECSNGRGLAVKLRQVERSKTSNSKHETLALVMGSFLGLERESLPWEYF